MEAATVTPPKQAPPEPAPEHDGAAEATKSTEELFQWSTYVHVGAGAEECEHKLDGKCPHPPKMTPDGGVEGHFHAWLCLPNVFQARDITEKANASRARRRRSLRQNGDDGREATDSAIVLEDQLAVWEANKTTWEALIRTIAQRNVDAQLAEITQEMADSDQWEHYAADVEEYRRLLRVPEDDRDPEDMKRLETDLEEYTEELNKRVQARMERETSVLNDMPRHEVLELQRRHMIDEQAQDAWYHTYYTWAYFTCARKPTLEGYPRDRVFERPEDLKNTAQEIVAALRSAYRSLESKMLVRSDAAGN